MYSVDIDLGAEMLEDLKQIRETLRKQRSELVEIIDISTVAVSKAEEDRCAQSESEKKEGVPFYYKSDTMNALVQILECINYLWENEDDVIELEPKQLDTFCEYNEKLLAAIIQLMGTLDCLEQIDVCLKEEMNTNKKKLFDLMP